MKLKANLRRRKIPLGKKSNTLTRWKMCLPRKNPPVRPLRLSRHLPAIQNLKIYLLLMPRDLRCAGKAERSPVGGKMLVGVLL